MSPMQRLILFDIDNTLISLNRGNLPQRRALNTAFEQVHRILDAFEEVAFTGGMDLPLMFEVYRTHGFNTDEPDALPDISRFKEVYFQFLTKNLESWAEGTICPGVPQLLDALSSTPGVQLGLETGNFRDAALIMLRRYGLHAYFADGGFGGDHTERSQVVASAVAACQNTTRRVYRPEEVFVIGDSPADIEAGNANGIRTLAVATGFYTVEHLGQFNPSYVLPDLSDTEAVLALLIDRPRENA